MIVYKDRVSGDELFTDSYKVVEQGVFYKVLGENKIEKSEDNFDIGANPSAEEAAEATEQNVVTGCNIVLENRLKQTYFTKKSYKIYIGGYMKSILESLDEDKKAAFKSEMQKSVLDIILPKFDDWQFFQGESQDAEGMVGLLEDVEDPTTKKTVPYMLFFKDGIIKEKQ